jgi:hypothetical protein
VLYMPRLTVVNYTESLNGRTVLISYILKKLIKGKHKHHIFVSTSHVIKPFIYVGSLVVKQEILT